MAKKKENHSLKFSSIEEWFDYWAEQEVQCKRMIESIKEMIQPLRKTRYSLLALPPSKTLLSFERELKSVKAILKTVQKEKQKAFEELKAQRQSTLSYKALHRLSPAKQRAILKSIARMKKRIQNARQRISRLMAKELSVKTATKRKPKKVFLKKPR